MFVSACVVPADVENREIEGDNKPWKVSTSIRQRISSMSQKFWTPTAGGSSPVAQRKSNFFVEPPIPEARFVLLLFCSQFHSFALGDTTV